MLAIEQDPGNEAYCSGIAATHQLMLEYRRLMLPNNNVDDSRVPRIATDIVNTGYKHVDLSQNNIGTSHCSFPWCGLCKPLT